DMRSMMTPETIQHNCDCFKIQMERFIEFGEDKAMMVNNADWLLDLNYIDLLREVGAHFSVNNMLRAECYKQRMERGLSFLEFNYMIMQAYDFKYLHDRFGCNMQFGGDDQWSNMLAGTELIRKSTGDDAYAMTITLLLNSEGKKMGKTAKGAVWLDPEKTSPFEFFQYWRNVDDADVIKCMKLLTFLPLDEIRLMESWEGAKLNEAKEILAYSLTEMVHGTEEADKAKEAAKALFSTGSAENMPVSVLKAEDFRDGKIDISGVLASAGLVASRSEGRRAVEQGGVTVNDEKVTDVHTTYEPDFFAGDGAIVKRGKKNFKRVTFEG
ncbi:MAG: tyrosine--tRNA ligase, partial [Lachnospiraceae bacterium]|nr:tyrosine--tRNA ligase [Lachnospiraceae bacterium]